jgi:hypothetical protein
MLNYSPNLRDVLGLTANSKVEGWGDNTHHQLSPLDFKTITSPTPIMVDPNNPNLKIKDISAQLDRSEFLTINGKLYGAGKNAGSKMLLGQLSAENDIPNPTIINYSGNQITDHFIHTDNNDPDTTAIETTNHQVLMFGIIPGNSIGSAPTIVTEPGTSLVNSSFVDTLHGAACYNAMKEATHKIVVKCFGNLYTQLFYYVPSTYVPENSYKHQFSYSE